MIPLADLLKLVFGSLADMVREPWTLLPLVLVAGLIAAQYRRMAAVEAALYGVPLHTVREQFWSSLLAGVAGGAIASLLFLVLGVSLPESGILSVWVLALLLMLIHPRFLCFSYAGGIVSLSSLLFGFPAVNVGGLMGLVALLHLVEAVLIRFTGARQATPIFVKRRDGRVVGGYALQKFWPVPFFAVLALTVPEFVVAPESSVAMPDWWPLIGAGTETTNNLMYFLFPVAAGLGYGDVAITTTPQQKARQTSNHLLVYSSALLILAVLADTHKAWAFAAALFSPLAHEIVIRLGQRREEIGEPLFTEDRGAMVLATIPGSVASYLGLQSGDIIRRFNGYPILERSDLARAMYPWALHVEMLVENAFTGEQRTVRHVGKVPPLGVILVPDQSAGSVVQFGRLGPLGRWLSQMRRRFSA